MRIGDRNREITDSRIVKIVGQGNAMPTGDFEYLMLTISIEGGPLDSKQSLLLSHNV